MKFYKKTWFISLMLFFVAPVGVFLLWKKELFSKNTRIVVSVFSAIFFIFIFSETYILEIIFITALTLLFCLKIKLFPYTKKTEYLVESIPTKVVGVTFECDKDGHTNRQILIKKFVHRKTKIYLDFYEFNGTPACHVVLFENGFDIGNLRKELAKDLVTKAKYHNCIFEAKITEKTGGTDDKLNHGCNIVIDIYKNKNIV